MTDAALAAFQRARDEITGLLDRQLVPLAGLAERIGGLVPADAIGRVTERQHLAPALPSIEADLAASETAAGLGFVAAPGVIEGRDHYLLWLQKQDGGIRRLTLNLDPSDPGLYDYHDTEWFTAARDRGGPAAYGPYIDYAGADLMVMTVGVPVTAGGRFIGVAGADLFAAAVEQRLTRLLRAVPGDAVLVGPDRCVVASGTPLWLPGERLAAPPERDPGRYRAVGPVSPWTGWVLALLAP